MDSTKYGLARGMLNMVRKYSSDDHGLIEAPTVIIIDTILVQVSRNDHRVFNPSQINLNVKIIEKVRILCSVSNDKVRGRGRQCTQGQTVYSGPPNCSGFIKYSIHLDYSATRAFSECGILLISFRL